MPARSSLTILAAGLFVLPLHGTDLSPEEDAKLSRQFVESQRALRTFRADFEQSVSLLGLRNPSVSRGTFLYRAPDDVRIDYSKPAGDFFLLSGDDFHVVKNGKPPRAYPATDKSARVLVALRKVMGGRTEGGSEMVRRVRREGNEYVITLKPKVPERGLPEKIENRLDTVSLSLRKMTVTLPQGTSMELTFSEPERNVTIDSELFTKP